MRIIAVPLTRPNPRVVPTNGTKLSRLTYYQFQISPKKKLPLPASSSANASDGNIGEGPTSEEKKGWLPEQGVMNWATKKAADIWSGFGKAEGGWKVRLFFLNFRQKNFF